MATKRLAILYIFLLPNTRLNGLLLDIGAFIILKTVFLLPII
ncbi:hypothetical protein [Fervidibacillus halotolerans]|uniref:Uncharacterized protein n=1 Tax=Fervidibacillus halotolerans TaxID=2980027 RepID=A0A9E8LZE1_9BACI|nr:hypothetical protein [Fervidibacillus halotolerans]WAA11801.1 hypothetical protein OE105_09260 [Fervidibacillus halotolerans]